MTFFNWIVNYWSVLVGVIVILYIAGFAIVKFAGLPTKEQVARIKEWLKYAVTCAEQDLGSGTGQLKLRTVYDMFLSKFPITGKFVTFEMFSGWVDDALIWMKEQLEQNVRIAEIVKGE